MILTAAAVAFAACGDSPGDPQPTPAKGSTVKFDPANFGDPATGANPYLPLVPGTQSVREGSTRVGGRRVPHQVTTTVTDAYREIDGVRTVLMLDHEVDGGQVVQVSVDYVAEDRDGNVWSLGGYTEEVGYPSNRPWRR